MSGEELEKARSEYSVDGGDIMVTKEDEKILSMCWVKASGREMEAKMLMSCDKDGADITIRGALAYGDNRGAMTCTAEHGEFDREFKCVGFTEKNGQLFIEINKVVHYGVEK